MSSRSKKILIVAYIFPPLARAGVHRTVRFVRYLPPLGWDITVLTANESYYPFNSPVDHALLQKIPDAVKVESTKIFRGIDTLLKLKNRGKKQAAGSESQLRGNEQRATSNKQPVETQRRSRCSGTTSNQSKCSENPASVGQPAASRNAAEIPPRRDNQRGFFQRGKNFISDLMTIPDKDVNWLPYALLAALRLHRRECFEVIYSTAPPFTGHLIAYLVKKFTGLPWVADFRDPWARAPWKAELMDGTLRGRAAEMLESKFVRAADRVILNTDWAVRDFAEYYGAGLASKFVVIPNGFDPEDFAGVQFPQKKDNQLVMTHTGSLYRKRDPGHFFDALGRLLATGQIHPEEIRLRFVGGIAPELYQSFQYGEALQHVLQVIPPVSHREALAYQAESDTLLILQPGTSVSVPGKIFEYIAMRKKILALTPAGATADVVRNHDLGIVVDPNDIDGIQRALLLLVDEFRRGGIAPPAVDGAFHKYDGARLTRQLHDELLRCAAKDAIAV